jgi:hypothetical protein
MNLGPGLLTLYPQRPKPLAAEIRRAQDDLKVPNLHRLEHRLQLFGSIPSVRMNEEIFWEDWPPLKQRHGYMKEGTTTQVKAHGNSWTFLIKFEGAVGRGSHEVNFLFHPTVGPGYGKPEALWGAKISTEGVWGTWMTSRRDLLRPIFNTGFEHFQGGKGWHCVRLTWCQNFMRIKIIQLEDEQRQIGGTKMWHFSHLWGDGIQMMLTAQARKGAMRLILIESRRDRSCMKQLIDGISPGVTSF